MPLEGASLLMFVEGLLDQLQTTMRDYDEVQNILKIPEDIDC